MNYKESLNNFHSAIVDVKFKNAEAVINSPFRGSKEERLKIYIEGYFIRITDALMEIYSAFTAKIGKDTARKLFADFLRNNPSPSYNLDTHCISFSDYFDKKSDNKMLRELVRLESEILKNHFREDSKPLLPQKLAELTPEDFATLVLKQRNESILLEFEYDVETYFQNHETTPLAEIKKADTRILICRKPDYQQKRSTLSKAECEFLKLLFADNTVDNAITKFTGIYPQMLAELEQNFQIWFSNWVQDGFFKE